MQDQNKTAAQEYAAALDAGGDNWGPAAPTIKSQMAALDKVDGDTT